MTHEEGSHANYPNMAVNIVGSAVNRPTIVLADHTAAFNGTNPQAVFHYMTDQTLQNPWNDKNHLIQPLGKGSFDVYRVVELFADKGYKGPIGIQCSNLKGSPEVYLKESIEAFNGFRLKYSISSNKLTR